MRRPVLAYPLSGLLPYTPLCPRGGRVDQRMARRLGEGRVPRMLLREVSVGRFGMIAFGVERRSAMRRALVAVMLMGSLLIMRQYYPFPDPKSRSTLDDFVP